jgi:hypothetical protein
MLRFVAWAAIACVALILVLALLRGGGPEPQRTVIPVPERTASIETAAPPAPAAAPKAETPPPVAAVEPTDEDLQVQEDAAAVGMTTREPETDSPPAADVPPT